VRMRGRGMFRGGDRAGVRLGSLLDLEGTLDITQGFPMSVNGRKVG